MTVASAEFDRVSLIAWYERNRRRTNALFALLTDQAYYSRPIAARHPIVFYEGHLPAFSFNTLVKKALGGASIDARLESLFARGIDPGESDAPAAAGAELVWPERRVVKQFADEADRRVLEALAEGHFERAGSSTPDPTEAAFAILEHEAMHQETLLYMWHRLPLEHKHRPADYRPRVDGAVPAREWMEVAGGDATLGVDRGAIPFGWDNEFGSYRPRVETFWMERDDVTNAAYMEFVEAGGYRDARWWRPEDWAWRRRERLEHPSFWERTGDRWFWRGLFDRIPLPPAWPVYVSHAEAAAYTAWRGARLPTEAEFQRAAYGTPDGDERRWPWGGEPPAAVHGVFDFASWDPAPAGSHPLGRSDWGVNDLVGNGWEWTSTVFAPFPGFSPMASYPEYSADFFDDEHLVMKGASPATARELLRPTLRNWFRPRYPFMYATFRCARTA